MSFSASAAASERQEYTPDEDRPSPIGQGRAESASLANIKGIVRWIGPPPRTSAVEVTRDAQVCAEHGKHERSQESLVVNPVGQGVRYCVVSLVTAPKDGKPLSELEYPDTLNQKTCSYEPRVFVVPVGARLAMTSEDEVGHNVRMAGAADLNVAIAKGGRITRRLERPGLIRVGCDVHPWMAGYIHVVKHSYYSVTDSDGRFELTGVPEGTHSLKFWHEAWWEQSGKIAEPIEFTRSLTVRAREDVHVVVELSDPTQTAIARAPKAKRKR